MEYLAQHIEGLIFTSEHPLSLKDIKSCLEETFETKFKEAELLTAIDQIIERYKGVEFSFEVLSIGGGYQFLTKGAYHQSIGTLLKQNTKKRLSIIAYKQPVTKGELEKIRGVSCDYAVQKLLEKELVTIIGRSEGPGRPLLYGTSQKFMDYFGLNSIADLPKPKDFKAPDSEVGEVAPSEEAVPQAVDVSGVDEIWEVEEAITVKIEDAAPGDAIVEPVSDESPTYEASVAIEAEETELLSEAEVLSEIEKGEEGLNHVATDIVAQEEE